MEHIQLANAHATQHTSGAEKTPWSIEENITDSILGELPKRLTEKEVFGILKFARKYELIAFNTGINFGKGEYKKAFDSTVNQLTYNLKQAKNENERLSEVIELLTNNK